MGGTGARYLHGKRVKSEVRELAGKSTSEEAEIRWSWKAHRGKKGNATEAPPSHGGFCYFQIWFWFKVTSTLPNFQKASSEEAVAWPQEHPSGGATDPRILAVLSCLPGCAWSCSLGYQKHQWGRAGRVPPALHLAQFAFRESLPMPFSLSRQTSDSLVLLGLSPAPPHQNHMALPDGALWEAGNAWQA